MIYTEQSIEAEQLIAALHQARATATARRNVIRMAREQIEFLRGKRKRAWEGDFLKRLCEAADGERDGCLTCDGRGYVAGCSPEPHIPAYPEPCPDCDPAAHGFARIEEKAS